HFNSWYGCIDDYSIRLLARGYDTYPALSGLVSAIYDLAMGIYLSGMWSEDLATGLIW
ncbi:hypothetical protein BJ878DRAFT_400412, partial [Calycina marina]